MLYAKLPLAAEVEIVKQSGLWSSLSIAPKQ